MSESIDRVPRLAIKIQELEAENAKLRQALEDIVSHQKKVAGTFGVHGATYHLAKQALGEKE